MSIRSSLLWSARLWGAVVAVAAFAAMVFELRYFTAYGTPKAGASTRGNWGTLLLMAVPWILMIAGLLQLFSGVAVWKYDAAFSALSLPRRIGIGLAVVIATLLATALAAFLV